MSKLFLSVALALTGMVGSAAQHDVSGTWDFVVELDIGSGEPTFEFTQDGETLTGTYQGTFGEAEVSGTVTGSAIEFRFGGQLGDAVYTGTVDGDTMKGTCDYGGLGEGTWEAERQ